MLQKRRAELAGVAVSAPLISGNSVPSTPRSDVVTTASTRKARPIGTTISSMHGATDLTHASPKNISSVRKTRQAPASSSTDVSDQAGMTAGPVPSRGGARHSAMAGVLRRLRMEQAQEK